MNHHISDNFRDGKSGFPDFTGKVAVVTGGSRGIGRSVCLALARGGAAVVVNYAKHKDEAENVLCSVKETGAPGIAVNARVQIYDEVAAMIDIIMDKFGKIDILINNAGIFTTGWLENLSEEDWNWIMDVNLKGIFNCSKAALPFMKERRYGRIINISSQAALRGSVCHTHYAASKAGVIGFTRSLAKEVGPYGITVNSVSPGRINTDILEPDNREQNMSRWLMETPLRRLGEPHEVASAVVFLASDEAGYITGQNLGVDGGLV